MRVSLRIASSVKLDSPQDTWLRRDFSGISLELPPSVVIKEEATKLKPDSKLTKSVQFITTFERVVISMIHLASEDQDVDLDAAADYSVATASKLLRSTSRVVPITCDGVPARIVKTEYQDDGLGMVKHTFLMAQGHDLWRVIVGGRTDDALKISERILGSVKMKG
jgi:hypothetical protein